MPGVTAVPAALRDCKMIPLRSGSKVPDVRHATFDSAARWDAGVDQFLSSGGRVGIFMGGNLVGLDIDVKIAYRDDTGNDTSMVMVTGMQDLSRLLAEAGLAELPRTLQVHTPSGGTHYYFRQNPAFPVGQCTIGCLDVRAARNSYLAIGDGYEIVDDGGGSLAMIPEQLARSIMSARREVARQDTGQQDARDGKYGDYSTAFNSALTTLKGTMIGLGWSETEANDAIRAVNSQVPDPIAPEILESTVLRPKGWEQGYQVRQSELEWAREQCGVVTDDDPDIDRIDPATVARLVTTERWRAQRKIDEAKLQLSRVEIMLGSDAMNAEPMQWQLHEILPAMATTGAIIGGRGSYKTTMALLMGAAITRGVPLLGRQTRQGPVVFVAGEAWEYTTRMIPKVRGAESMIFVNGRFGLSVQTAPTFCDMIMEKLSRSPSMVIFDALSRFHNGKENDAEEMLPVWDGADWIARELETFVFLIAHTGHQGEHIRGSSSWGQALSTEIFTDGTILRFNKQRGVQKPDDINLRYQFTSTDIIVEDAIDMAALQRSATQKYVEACKLLAEQDGCNTTQALSILAPVVQGNRTDVNNFLKELHDGGWIRKEGSGGRGGYQIFVNAE